MFYIQVFETYIAFKVTKTSYFDKNRMAAKPNFGILNKGGQMELNDNYTVVAELKTRIRKFVTDRDWDQYHYPKDLAIGLAIEAAELLEHFRFRSNDELEELTTDTEFRQCVAHELADVLYFVLLMFG